MPAWTLKMEGWQQMLGSLTYTFGIRQVFVVICYIYASFDTDGEAYEN